MYHTFLQTNVLAILQGKIQRKKVVDGAALADKLLQGDVEHYFTDTKQTERRFLVKTLATYLMKSCAV